MMNFKNKSLEEHYNQFCEFLPKGRAWQMARRDDSNFKKYIMSIYIQKIKEYDDMINAMITELQPESTTLYINEFEEMYKIPDSFIAKKTTLNDRRGDILFKKYRNKAFKLEDWLRIATFYGHTVVIKTPQSRDRANGWEFQIPLYDADYANSFSIEIYGSLDAKNTLLDLYTYLAPVYSRVYWFIT